MKQDLHIGVVASLHSLGLLDACCREDERLSGWQTAASPGHGGLLRQMRAKRVDAALLPLDWFATHFLEDEEAEPTSWKVVQAWPHCALEFWMCRHLKKRLARRRRTKPGAERGLDQDIRVAIEGASPLIADWVTQRIREISGRDDLPLTFQHLPIRMMPGGVKAGLVDGIVAPAPWSQADEIAGEGSIDRMIVPPTHDLGLVLVVDLDSEAAEPAKTRQLIELCRVAGSDALDPKRLACSQHAALSVHNPEHLLRQIATLPSAVPEEELAHWLQQRLEILRRVRSCASAL